MILRSNNGTSLVQVLMAMGVLGILTLVSAQLINDIFKAISTQETVLDKQDLYNNITAILSDEDKCTQALQNQRMLNGENITINHSMLAKPLSSGVQVGALHIKSLDINSIEQVQPGSYLGYINLNLEKKQKAWGTKEFSFNIPLYFKKDSSNNLTKCYQTISLESFCKEMDGVYIQGNPGHCDLSTLIAKEACKTLVGTFNTEDKKCTLNTSEPTTPDSSAPVLLNKPITICRSGASDFYIEAQGQIVDGVHKSRIIVKGTHDYADSGWKTSTSAVVSVKQMGIGSFQGQAIIDNTTVKGRANNSQLADMKCEKNFP